MPRKNQKVWLGCAGVAAIAVTGCQSSQTRTSPGALPGESTADTARPDKTPTINASTYFAHAHLLERQGAFERALEQYRKVLELQPDFIGARNRMGITLNKLGKHADATTQFKLALQKQPNSAYLHNNYGFSLFLEKRYEEARVEFEKSISLKNDFSRARMNYGVTLGKLGYFDQAFEQFTKVCAPADAHFNLAVLLTEAGNYGEAATSLEQALAINPKFEAARVQLTEVARLAAEVDAQMKAIADAKAAAEAVAAAKASEAASGTPNPIPPLSAEVILTGDDDGADEMHIDAPLPPVEPAEAFAPTDDTTLTADVDCDAAAPNAAVEAVEPGPETPSQPVRENPDLVLAADPSYDDAEVRTAPTAPAGLFARANQAAEFEIQAIGLLPFGECVDPFSGTSEFDEFLALTDPFVTRRHSPSDPVVQPAGPAASPALPPASECDDDDRSIAHAVRVAELIERMLESATSNVGQIDTLLNRLEQMIAPQRSSAEVAEPQ